MGRRAKSSVKAGRQIQALRKLALSFPQTREDHPWDHVAFKVKKKIFLVVAEDADGWGVTVKLDESHASAMAKPFVSPTRYGLGKHGWVTARFGPKEDAPLELLKRWATESFTVVAPLKVLQELEGEEAARPRKKRR